MTQDYKEYLDKHISSVKTCYNMLTGKELQGHDFSKYSYQELQAYDNYFYPEANRVEKDEKVKSDFDYAWLHHQNLNRHHWQYWVLVNDDDGKNKALEIPDRYILEMVSDWGSFAYQKGNGQELLDWYDSHKGKMLLAPNTKEKVEKLVNKLANLIGIK